MATLTIKDTAPLNNTKTTIPRLGFGVYQLYGDKCSDAVAAALEAGFRHFDSANMYRNEANVAATVAQSSVSRDQVFLTTKLHPSTSDADALYSTALQDVEKLGGGGDGYVDLFLIHQPGSSPEARQALWGVLERLYDEGRAKAIGVSNYHVKHIQEMKPYARVWPPHVNQIELHPWCQQRQLVKYCQDSGILVEAYSPLSCGENLGDQALAAMAAKHGKAPAQLLIRYALQKGHVPLPKSGKVERIKQNANVFDFALDKDDMAVLDGLDKGPDGAFYPASVK
ncbi:hypothetical protein CDD82_7101 [Ophiocordyceps australis]|uniref:NADP-dependent oxidoreductase domain-containing protein n=1 Tax=Ophiocordyceps australis TaxID=1399860 RepID=A0A2C5YU61_9HYPO|nr:hypothetical protein CDD82_7101 [Ophiocordyceps australis]